MNEEYRKLIEQIKLDGEDYVDEEMNPVYREQKKALDSTHAFIGALFIKFAIDGLLKMNSTQKANSGINEYLKNIGKTLGDAEVKTITDILETAYSDTYYKNAFIMDSGLKIDLKFDILKKEFIDAAVNTKYKGEIFSDRIWKNKANMLDKLQASITDAMQGKTTIDKVARDIRNTFNVQAYESQRLVHTENARIQTQASYDIGISSGVEQVMYSATLDMLTNPIDASFDSNIYDIDDNNKPEIPQHPNCRCCYINIPYKGWQPTQRKDNETKGVIDYKNYDTWLKDKGVD
jgi:SPP1 gp7 family putative phage head morphogenesis protein